MGGRGSSSGISKKGNAYGTQYHTLFQDGDVKYITKNGRQSEPLMETMTKGRIYATVNGNEVKAVTFFDDDNKRNVLLEKDENTGTWHAHRGYYHNEYGNNAHDNLTPRENAILDNIIKKWNNHK